MRKPILIAHRGDAINFSENTIEAFQSAYDLGADGIELDVHLDQDGQVIVVHDYLYDLTKEYPLLTEIIEKFATKGRLEIEIKSFDSMCVSKVADIINSYNPPDYELTSSVLPILPLIPKSLPKAEIGMIFPVKLIEDWMMPNFIVKMLLAYMKLTGSKILHLDLDKYSSELVEKFHSNDYLLHTHLKTGDLDKYVAAKELGIDQCTFHDINLLKIVS